jgi:ABC-type thiamine transport system ATPase subunit
VGAGKPWVALGVRIALHLEELVVAVPPPDGGTVTASLPPLRPGERRVLVAGPAAGAALAAVIVGVARPIGGRVWIGGTDVTDLPPHRRPIGYAPARWGILPHRTVRQNVAYGQLRRQRSTVTDAEAERHVDAAVHRLQLESCLDRYPHELPRRTWARIALARATVKPPDVLVVDMPEPDDAPDIAELLDLAGGPESAMAVLVCTRDPTVRRALATARATATETSECRSPANRRG